jgi:hypothetical protein
LQGELFLLFASVINRYEPVDLQQLLDDDVAEAAGALASTLETAARGVIYEHRPETRPAERLVAAFKALLVEAAKGGAASRLEREAVLVLRRLEQAARPSGPGDQPETRALIELLGRMIRTPLGESRPEESRREREPSRLIVP